MPALEKARLSGGTRKIQRTRVQTSEFSQHRRLAPDHSMQSNIIATLYCFADHFIATNLTRIQDDANGTLACLGDLTLASASSGICFFGAIQNTFGGRNPPGVIQGSFRQALVKDLPKLNAAASFTPASFTPPKTSFPFARLDQTRASPWRAVCSRFMLACSKSIRKILMPDGRGLP